MDLVTLIWLGAGVGLMLLELAMPGLVVVFMGAAAVMVAGLRSLGLVESLPVCLGVWMGLSVSLVVALRGVFKRFLPAEVRRDLLDEHAEAIDQVVEVVVACDPDAANGRIRFQGTSWPARTVTGSIPAGEKARLCYRDNLSWVVEPLSEASEAELRSLDD